MASPVYSHRLLAGATTSTSYEAVVPSGVLWVVRDVVAWWDGTSDPSVELYSLSYGPENVVLMWGNVESGVARVLEHWEGRQVLNAGDTLQFATTTATWSVAVTGYVLTLP